MIRMSDCIRLLSATDDCVWLSFIKPLLGKFEPVLCQNLLRSGSVKLAPVVSFHCRVACPSHVTFYIELLYELTQFKALRLVKKQVTQLLVLLCIYSVYLFPSVVIFCMPSSRQFYYLIFYFRFCTDESSFIQCYFIHSSLQ